jgi:hypothetical protein
MEPGDGQSITQHSKVKCLEKEQTNQDDDRNPCDRVPDDDSVPETAVRRQPVVLHQRAAVQTFGHHGRLPGIVPRSGRLANRGRLCFLRSLTAIGQFVRLNHSLSQSLASDCGGSLWLSMNRLVQDNDVTAICCHCPDAALVQFECGESNKRFCSAIFDYAWQRRFTRNPLTRSIDTKRFRTNWNIASHNSR